MQQHVYDTIEHDMRHSREYLSNVKFNYIEVLHKVIFLEKIKGPYKKGLPDPRNTSANNLMVKKSLIEAKEEVESLRSEMEKLSYDFAQTSASLHKAATDLANLQAKQAEIRRRIEEAQGKERAIRECEALEAEKERKRREKEETRKEIEELLSETQKKEREQTLAAQDLATCTQSLVQKRRSLQALEQAANKHIVFQFEWYSRFSPAFFSLTGIRVLEVGKIERHHVETKYASINHKAEHKTEKASEVVVKMQIQKSGETHMLTLSFLEGAVHSYALETSSSTTCPNEKVAELFRYCEKLNALRFFIFQTSRML